MDATIFRVALARLNLPAIAIARRVGVHHSVLSAWVHGYYDVPRRFRRRLAKALRVRTPDLFPPMADNTSGSGPGRGCR